jgi:hypothetical protein
MGSEEIVPASSEGDRTSEGDARRPTDPRIVRFFLLTLGVLLMAYAFLGRGFAHIGIGPVYVGEFVLALGLVATAWAALTGRFALPTRSQISQYPVVVSLLVLLVAFMALGLIRTVPYLPADGTNALRDATLWGYAVFALMIFVLLDRDWVLRLFKLYGYAAIAFLIWAPIAYYIFVNTTTLTVPGSFIYTSFLIPNAPGSNIPILFFKAPDMAVQTAGAIAFLVVGTPLIRRLRDFLWRFGAAVPASWMVYTTGAVTRGGLAAVAASLAVLGVLTAVTARLRNWAPLLGGALLVAVVVSANVSVTSIRPASSPSAPIAVQAGRSPSPKPTATTPTPTPTPTTSTQASGASQPTLTPKPTRTPRPTRTPKPPRTPKPTHVAVPPRAATTKQWWENIISIFTSGGDAQLQDTKDFRLRWWGKIIDYTFNGPYFWTGKGFGINLADSDGFQVTKDDSLRAPHNSHLSVLARMGVPGFFLWILLQLAFALLLLRALLAHRRAGDSQLATVAAWVLAFWVAIMVDTAFDPYLEGPQGGIWFWALFGLGLVVIRLVPRRKAE